MRLPRPLLLFAALALMAACSLTTDLNGFVTTLATPDAESPEPIDGGSSSGAVPTGETGAPDAPRAEASAPIDCKAPSFCDAFDNPVLDPGWDTAVDDGTLAIDTSAARSAPGSLLLTLPGNPTKKSRRSVLSRNNIPRAARLRCQVALRVDDTQGPDPEADIDVFKIGQIYPGLDNQNFGIAVSRSELSLYERGTGSSYQTKALGAVTLKTWTLLEIDTDFKTVAISIDGKPVLAGEKVEEVTFNSFYINIGAAFDTDNASWVVRFDDLACQITPR